ncbi:calcium activated cation channel [Hymenopellis radicata]|nr:calcium activated cation channel [Hymenopellis radicata]
MSTDNDPESASLISIRSVTPTPDTLTKLVKRLRALTLTLLPVEVHPDSLNDPTGRIITPQVISAYRAAAGDFVDALPYCLLRARSEFMWDANHNAADYGENYGRAIACEVLARRIVHSSPPDRISVLMSARYRHKQMDGDSSDMTSALEMAIDSHCTIFLSSTEAQDVVGALWRGELIQKNNDHLDIEYVPYADVESHSYWGHLDPSRLSVPRYQNIIRITIWLVLLVVYSQTVKQPAERLDPLNSGYLDVWEIIFYVLALSITLEDVYKFFQLLGFVTWRAFSFWNVISLVTDALMASAFALRIAGMYATDEDSTNHLRIASFQVLSFVSPFIWMKLVTVFDGYKYIGTMQICIARMLQESGIFFALLSLMAVGFAQALYALDAADGQADPPSGIANVLIQALLQSPDFSKFDNSVTGMIMFYFWNVVTALILLNVLISLFSSAYSDVVDDAEAQYLAFFAGKTVGMIRAPDAYVYPAPFNLIEIVLVSPFEWIPGLRLSAKNYANLNRFVMRFVFLVPLAIIALYESTISTRPASWVTNWMRGIDEGDENYPHSRDPVVDNAEDHGLEISKVPFMELIKVFPNTAQSSEALILCEIADLKRQLGMVLQKLDGVHGTKSE